MILFGTMCSEVQQDVGDETATTLILIKGWLNKAKNIFNASVRMHVTRDSRTANVVANQQYYQTPRECIRVSGISVDGVPMVEIKSEQRWRELNYSDSTGTPTNFFIKGTGEYGLYPIPSEAIASGIEVYFESREKDMTADNYTSGTITVVNGSQTITHSATGFTASMVGRYLAVTDGTDGFYYKIGTFISTSALGLENVYEGPDGAAKTFIIGESPQIPEEYHESLEDYAKFRWYLRQKDREIAMDFKKLFEADVERAKTEYGPKTTGRVIPSRYNQPHTNIFDQIETIT